jgi:hypothetical protein
LYRIAALHDTDVSAFNICFTDVPTCAALGRVIEGPIQDFADIEAAETALNAILFHTNVEILIPTIKLERHLQPGILLRTYARPDRGQRSEAAFKVFSVPAARDWLCASDYVAVDGGRVVFSQRQDNSLLGLSVEEAARHAKQSSVMATDVFPSLAFDLKVPGYFSDSSLINRYKAPQNFAHELYDRIKLPWDQYVSSVPGVELSIQLPPLLAVVLTRAKKRGDIPDVVRALHDELGPVRYELIEFDHMVRSSSEQVALENKTKRIQESFAAIVPESRLDTGRNTIARMWSLVRPLRQTYNIAINPISIDAEKLQELVESCQSAVMQDASLADRTTSARTFTKLVRTESMLSLLKRHFTTPELAAMEKTFAT